MRVNEAKDVLVNEIARQADLEGIALSDIERRMLYFTEEEDCPEDPSALDEEFESENNSTKYEAKISGLARRARRRLKKENAAGLQVWNEAVRELKKGDHYLLVMLGTTPSSGAFSFPSFLITLGLGLLIVAVIIVVIVASDHYGIDLPEGHSNQKGIPRSGMHSQMPVWTQRLLLAGMIAMYLYGVAYTPIHRFLANSSQKIFGAFRKS